jgi:serine/threonine protein kinase
MIRERRRSSLSRHGSEDLGSPSQGQQGGGWLSSLCGPFWGAIGYLWQSSGAASNGLNRSYNLEHTSVRTLRQIGEGGFSFVFLAEDVRVPGRVFALKIIRTQTPEQLQNAKQELEIQSNLNHPNLLPLEDQVIIDDHSVPTGESKLVLLLFAYYPVGCVSFSVVLICVGLLERKSVLDKT